MLNIVNVLVRDPRSLNKVIDDEVIMKGYVIKRCGLERGLPTVDLFDLFPGFNETVDPYAYLHACMCFHKAFTRLNAATRIIARIH
jgi:hypothetical protein